MKVDGNRVAMQYGSIMISQDITATPITSPITNGSGSGIVLTKPDNAVQIMINSSVTCQVGEDGSYVQGFQIPASTLVIFDCADQQFIYLKPSSSTNTIWFQFAGI